jgi:hypothetical protein
MEPLERLELAALEVGHQLIKNSGALIRDHNPAS